MTVMGEIAVFATFQFRIETTMYEWNLFTQWATGKITWGTLVFACDARPAAAAGAASMPLIQNMNKCA